VDELINTLEFEAMAQRKLDSLAYALISGSDRRTFERITFRPRMMVNTTKLDLSCELLGTPLIAPIIAGPIADQKRFHPEGEVATAKGAAAARTVVVIPDRASVPLEQAAVEAKAGFWFQAFPDTPKERLSKAFAAGCRAVCLTLSDAPAEWKAIDALRAELKMPFVIKGIMRPDEAAEASRRGVQGIVVSNYTGKSAAGVASSLEVLPAIVEAAGAKTCVMIDGSFRRGVDILMALALGARGVMIARPVMWGLAAYGAVGVQRVLEMLQTELARAMAMCGKPNLAAIDASVIKVHRW
jgi:4-hydroxymandelate oxidase